MDHELRELARRVAAGDEEARRRLLHALRRLGPQGAWLLGCTPHPPRAPSPVSSGWLRRKELLRERDRAARRTRPRSRREAGDLLSSRQDLLDLQQEPTTWLTWFDELRLDDDAGPRWFQ